MTTSVPHLLPLAEFMVLTSLDPSMLIRLLETGGIPFEKGPLGELLVDMERFDVATLTSSHLQDRPSVGELRLIEEAVATELVNSLEGMLDEAFAMAMRWKEAAAERETSEAAFK